MFFHWGIEASMVCVGMLEITYKPTASWQLTIFYINPLIVVYSHIFALANLKDDLRSLLWV